MEEEREEITRLMQALECIVGDLDVAVDELSNVVEKDEFTADLLSADKGASFRAAAHCRRSITN